MFNEPNEQGQVKYVYYSNIRYVGLVTESEARFTESETRFSFSFNWFGFGFVLIQFRI